jgi:hypothetical protein
MNSGEIFLKFQCYVLCGSVTMCKKLQIHLIHCFVIVNASRNLEIRMRKLQKNEDVIAFYSSLK